LCPLNQGPSDHAKYDGSQEREYETDGHKLHFTEHRFLPSLSIPSIRAFKRPVKQPGAATAQKAGFSRK
ncbi:MAG TPA: hypothetical protein VL026_05745, partial [Rhizomicrobium sp.]|nr:hypothetical protein [Rhizomicrobium sp.]